ncbi:DUF5694 domain-containing protein [Niabella yanshanensis]|uniref:DUF5694 domain-containing protein n=1 Tax=Niabella yanshanensis TaxID=577386 RepID=A0ABZ0W1Y9_9BACT|nr:DUF5694 domain-containing protein [Niabella yanshanensis]WQD37278.1 DUF5694 domain-containing protein [Niabella yanshanensis]
MKYSFLFFLLAPFNTYAQKVNVLLIGVAHNYSKSPRQDLSNLYAQVRNFKPTAFFGEFLSKEDERLVMDYWCKEDNMKRLKTLRNNRDIKTDRLSITIDSLKTRVISNPENYRLKADLAHAFYLNQDVSNAHYQYWQVWNHLKKFPNIQLENYVSTLLSPDSDTTGRSMRRLKTSEYALIAFPLMQEMNIRELLPMDCQDYDLNWSASALAFYARFEAFKKDTTASYAKELEALLTKRIKGFEAVSDIEKESTRFTEWLNTNEASAILASGDFYFPELYDLKDFPKEEILSQIHWWLMRNKGMCENVVNTARALGHQKVVVIAGANHRKYMQDIFEKMPGVAVKNINNTQ